MLLLTSVDDKIQIVTDAAIPVSVHASYVDKDGDDIVPGRKNTLITTATTTDVVLAPGASIQRNVQQLNVVNTHATLPVTITVRQVDGTNTVDLRRYILPAGARFILGQTAIELVSTSDKLRMLLDAAVDVAAHVSYVEDDAGDVSAGRQHTLVATATTHDILSSPAAGKVRRVPFVSITNTHVSNAVTVDLIHTDGTTAVVLRRVHLHAGRSLQFLEYATHFEEGRKLIGGFTTHSFDNGTKSSGTFTVDPVNGNIQHYVNGGAHILAPPDEPCTVILQVTNNASAGSINTAGFTLVTGNPITLTNARKMIFQIIRIAAWSHLHVTYLPEVGEALAAGFVGFRAHKNGTNQAYTASSPVKMTATTEAFDVGECYDAANSRFQPNISGYYQVYAQIYFLQGSGSGTYSQPMIMKNGATTVATSNADGFFYDNSLATGPFGATAPVIFMNGTTDYLECWFGSNLSGNIQGPAHHTFWQASLLGGIPGPQGAAGAAGAAGVDGASAPGFTGFRANKNGVDQSYTAAAFVKVTMTNEEFDVGGCYDAPNSRFNPQTPGKYIVYFQSVITPGSGTNNYAWGALTKNGATPPTDVAPFFYGPASTSPSSIACQIFDMNGTTDYIEAWMAAQTNSTILGSKYYTFMWASLIGGVSGPRGFTGASGGVDGADAGFPLWGGKVVYSVSGNDLTIAIKTLAGSDPEPSVPVKVLFANPTAGNSGYTTHLITAPTSIVIPNGGTLAVIANQSFKVWAVGILDGSTFKLGATQRYTNETRISDLSDHELVTSLAVGTGSDSAGVIYTTAAVSGASPMRILGFGEWGATTLATPGAWASAPDLQRQFGPGVKTPGAIMQTAFRTRDAMATGTNLFPMTTISVPPVITDGTQFMERDIVVKQKSNLLVIAALIHIDASAIGQMGMGLFRDAVTNALTTASNRCTESGMLFPMALRHFQIAPSLTPNYRIRAGLNNASTYTFNGSGGVGRNGGLWGSYLEIQEFQT